MAYGQSLGGLRPCYQLSYWSRRRLDLVGLALVDRVVIHTHEVVPVHDGVQLAVVLANGADDRRIFGLDMLARSALSNNHDLLLGFRRRLAAFRPGASGLSSGRLVAFGVQGSVGGVFFHVRLVPHLAKGFAVAS